MMIIYNHPFEPLKSLAKNTFLTLKELFFYFFCYQRLIPINKEKRNGFYMNEVSQPKRLKVRK